MFDRRCNTHSAGCFRFFEVQSLPEKQACPKGELAGIRSCKTHVESRLI